MGVCACVYVSSSSSSSIYINKQNTHDKKHNFSHKIHHINSALGPGRPVSLGTPITAIKITQ